MFRMGCRWVGTLLFAVGCAWFAWSFLQWMNSYMRLERDAFSISAYYTPTVARQVDESDRFAVVVALRDERNHVRDLEEAIGRKRAADGSYLRGSFIGVSGLFIGAVVRWLGKQNSSDFNPVT